MATYKLINVTLFPSSNDFIKQSQHHSLQYLQGIFPQLTYWQTGMIT